MTLEIEQFTCRDDNFGILARNKETGTVFLVDAPEEGAIMRAIERTGWRATWRSAMVVSWRKIWTLAKAPPRKRR